MNFLNKIIGAGVLLSCIIFALSCSSSSSSSGGSSSLRLVFANTTYTTIALTVLDPAQTATTIAVGDSVVYTFTNPGTIDYHAETSGKTTGLVQIGLLLTWNYTALSVSGKTYKRYDLYFPATFFFLRMRNWPHTAIGGNSHALTPLYVNYGLSDQTLDNSFTLPADSVLYNIGYYHANQTSLALGTGNTTIRAYYQTAPSSYTFWTAGTHFNFPNTNNQLVFIYNNFKPNLGKTAEATGVELSEENAEDAACNGSK
jgi:hypothetical protein